MSDRSSGLGGLTGARQVGRLAPVRRTSTVDLIADRLREAVVDGSLPPGAALGEAELAYQLGVSRGPLREAMQRLTAKGSSSSRGAAAWPCARSPLRTCATSTGSAPASNPSSAAASSPGRWPSARPCSPNSATRSSACSAPSKDDARALGDAYLDFHRGLAAWGGSIRLARMMSTLLIETRLCTFSMYEHFEVAVDLVPEHAAFVEALAAEDLTRFNSLMRAHLDAEVRRLLAEPETAKEDDADRLLAETPDEPQPLDRLDLPEGI